MDDVQENPASYIRDAALRVSAYPRHIFGAFAVDVEVLMSLQARFNYYHAHSDLLCYPDGKMAGEMIYNMDVLRTKLVGHHTRIFGAVDTLNNDITESIHKAAPEYSSRKELQQIRHDAVAELLMWEKNDNRSIIRSVLTELQYESFGSQMEFYQLIFDNPEVAPYFQVNIFDTDFINKCIADDIDPSLALTLYPDVT